MNTILLIILIALAIMLIGHSYASSWRCPLCGSRMYRYYDEVNDRKVWFYHFCFSTILVYYIAYRDYILYYRENN